MSEVLLTGGAGFIGSHVAERLLAEGHQVTIYDNLSSGLMSNLQACIGRDGFRFIESDLLDIKRLTGDMRGHDIVWHLGANTDIVKGNITTDHDLANCTVATRNVLEAMRQNEVGSIVFASSACVYGDTPPGTALDEEYGPLLPINLYGAGKLACEGLISAFSHLFGIRARMFRFGNVVGGRMGHGVIFDFIHKLIINPEELEILGDGRQEKNFFLVEDCIDGMLCALHRSDAQCDVFTLGNDTHTRVTRVAEIVAEEMGLRDVRFRFTGGSRGWPGDAPTVRFGIHKMRALGWRPRHSSDAAVRIAARRLIDQAGWRR